MKHHPYFFSLTLSLLLAATCSAQTTYTWLGSTSDLSLDTNWTPGGGPPSAFGPDDAVFNASSTVKTGLATNGAFSSKNVTFSVSSYSFGTSSGGDSFSVGDGTTGTLSILSGSSVNFSDLGILVSNSMNWAVNGNSAITGSGLVTASDLALGINFGAAQTNIVRLGNLALGSTGALTINNWGGTLGVYGGTNNQLRFTSDPTSFLTKISFAGYSGTVATQNMGSFYEVIAVPEPKIWLMLALGLTVVVVFRRRQKA